MARPRKKVRLAEDQIYELAKIGCTNREIAILADMDNTLLEKRFSNFLSKGREDGKTRLRQLQWKSAEKGNVAMLIWLGKQVLSQTEKVENQNTNQNISPAISRLPDEKLKRILEAWSLPDVATPQAPDAKPA